MKKTDVKSEDVLSIAFTKYANGVIDKEDLTKLVVKDASVRGDLVHHDFFNKLDYSKNKIMDKIVDFDLEKVSLPNLVDSVEKLDKISRLEMGKATENSAIRLVWDE